MVKWMRSLVLLPEIVRRSLLVRFVFSKLSGEGVLIVWGVFVGNARHDKGKAQQELNKHV